MSYVPKYILKRMVPPDALKLASGGAELLLINVIQPLPADQIPGDPLDFLEIKVKGKQLTKDEMSKITATWEGKTFNLGNIRDAGTIPIGAQIKFFFPTTDVKKGEEVTIVISVPALNVNIEITRPVQ